MSHTTTPPANHGFSQQALRVLRTTARQWGMCVDMPRRCAQPVPAAPRARQRTLSLALA